MIIAQAFSRFAIDLDGVVWRGNTAIPGAAETLEALRAGGKSLAFVTNNSARDSDEVADKLRGFGVSAEPKEVVTSADAVVSLIDEKVPGARGRLAFVLGGPGLEKAAMRAGMQVADLKRAADASVVLVGLDPKLSYERLRAAVTTVRNGAYLIASNADPHMPVEDDLWPGSGSILAAVVTATGASPMIAGKPDPRIFRLAENILGGTPALAVGDQVTSDVAAAHAAGWSAALVLTGVTTLASLAMADAWPEFLLRRPSDLLDDLPHGQVRPASGGDLTPIAGLLHRAGLRSGGARERLGKTVVVEAERGKVLATASVDPVSQSRGVLRSVAVAEAYASKGCGTLAVAGALRLAARTGLSEVYIATETAERFFSGIGFTEVPRDRLPDEVAEHPQISRECPITAPTMALALR
jgi:glycerol-1-phosphatase